MLGNGSGGTIKYTPTGKYSIESVTVSNPDLRMGQEVIYWHIPEEFQIAGPFNHDGSASSSGVDPLIVTHTAHGYANGKILQLVGETTGTVDDGEYQVSDQTTNTYKLKTIKSKTYLKGSGNAGTISRYADDSNVSYPLFYGTITNLSEEWHPAYGKLIKFQAKDHLQFLNNTSVKQILKTFRTIGERIGGGNDEGGAAHRMQAGSTQSPIYLDGAKVDGDSDVVETKVSHAVANIVSDFNEGAGFIHTNNQNGDDDFGDYKFEESGFEMTQEELKSGMFKRDLSDVGHKVLRAMQDMAMSERHVTVDASSATATWAVASTNDPFVITSASHGVSNGQTISVLSCGVGSPDASVYVPNGLYLVTAGTTNTFQLQDLNGTSLTSSIAGSGTALSWAGAEDGNFGYDFFLDSGLYGVPDEYGYTIEGGSTNYAPRPHLNYFKRGYRQFRPDATGLNLISPVEPSAEETGQIRIMKPNTQWETGDDEVMSDVELQITGTDEGDSDKSDLGHNLQLLRIKKLQCCNNVDAFSGAANQRKRLNHAGRWNGEFHWNRHDSFKVLDITDTTGSGGWNPENEPAGGNPPEAQEVQLGANDQAMFVKSGEDLDDPSWEDNVAIWEKSKVGRASDGGTGPNMWGGGTLNPGYGSIQDREILRRVIGDDIGGSVLTGNTDEGGIRTSGYAGPSQVPVTGRSFRLGPGAKTKNMEWREPFQWITTGGQSIAGIDVMLNGTKHTYPAYSTGIVDCDLIKSIKNCEEEGLFEQGTFLSSGPCTMRGDTGVGATGDVIITMNGGGGHSLQTGAMIRIVSGELYDATDYWNNYKRVEMAGITGADFGINSETGVHTASKFYITNLPYEAYEGIEEEGGTIPAASGLSKITWNGSHTVGSDITFQRVFNVFDGVCRVQYQSTKTRNEAPHTDSYVLISDRQRLDVPTMGVEVYAVADEDRISSNGEPSGLTTGAATMPDAVNYPLTDGVPDISAAAGLAGGAGRRINGVLQECAVPVSFKKGDKISETRFLFRDENTTTDSPTSGVANCKHLFKNTQAIITQNLMEDKKRAKSQGLTYAVGNDFNEVRRTAAAMLTRSSKDMIRGRCEIIRYPFIKLTGQIRSGFYTGTTFYPTQAVTTYGGRAGMLVTKTDTEDGEYEAGVLAEKVSPQGMITGTLSNGDTWAVDDWYRMYIHLRAGHSVRCTDPLNGMSSNMICTKITYKEGVNTASTTLEVIGYQDLPTGTPVRPLGNISKSIVENKGGTAGPITLGKASVTDFSLSAGDS
jgi:hypothetical protein